MHTASTPVCELVDTLTALAWSEAVERARYLAGNLPDPDSADDLAAELRAARLALRRAVTDHGAPELAELADDLEAAACAEGIARVHRLAGHTADDSLEHAAKLRTASARQALTTALARGGAR